MAVPDVGGSGIPLVMWSSASQAVPDVGGSGLASTRAAYGRLAPLKRLETLRQILRRRGPENVRPPKLRLSSQFHRRRTPRPARLSNPSKQPIWGDFRSSIASFFRVNCVSRLPTKEQAF